MENNRKELFLEVILQGTNLGIILLTSSLFILSILGTEKGLHLMTLHFSLLFAGYVVLGILIKLWNHLFESHFKWFHGLPAFYCLSALFFLLTTAVLIFPDYIRYMLLADFAVLMGLWLIDYRYISSIARELNHLPAGRNLVIDLDEKPKSAEDFFALLENHCLSNHISLTYISREIPAIVELNGIRHRVELNYYYSYGGPVYTMDIISM